MPRTKKLAIGVLFGGRSAEHEVSLVSASSVIGALDRRKYSIVPIGITPEGRWVSTPDCLDRLKRGRKFPASAERILLPDPTVHGLVSPGRRPAEVQRLDVIIPVLHGSFGEDGTVQGLFELAGIPYVGAGVLGSAVGMDKVVAKQLCERAGIRVVPCIWFHESEYRQTATVKEAENKLGYPMFVKPANSGSSVGISKAHDRRELVDAIALALRFDRKVLVEKSIEPAREIEVSVLGNDDPVASVPGEIISSNEFYDYDAKYVDGKSREVIPARLAPKVVKELQKCAVRTFSVLNCSGMGRVDFLLSGGRTIYLNEINTIPGFTSISMYPKLWQASGVAYPRLLDILIRLALDRYRKQRRLRTSFTPKKKWYTE
ncbi:MAG TPA: D-alanine--D-alanine ligase family protein [Bacteroidota bacterium]|nr:D-alanine--D-alanine ligase family protein [Bacteroidota bacterium]